MGTKVRTTGSATRLILPMSGETMVAIAPHLPTEDIGGQDVRDAIEALEGDAYLQAMQEISKGRERRRK